MESKHMYKYIKNTQCRLALALNSQMFGVFVWGCPLRDLCKMQLTYSDMLCPFNKKTGYTYVNPSNYKHELISNRALFHDLQSNNASVSSLEYNLILN